MRFLRAFFFATAVCSAAVLPDAAGGAPTLPEHEPVTELAAVDPLFSRQAGDQPRCLPFPDRLFHFRRRTDQRSFQLTIDNSAQDTYDVGGVTVMIQAASVHTNNNIGVVVRGPRGERGHIILVNYRNTWWRTRPRHTIRINYVSHSIQDCVRLPRLDGTWYIQKGAPDDEL